MFRNSFSTMAGKDKGILSIKERLKGINLSSTCILKNWYTD